MSDETAKTLWELIPGSRALYATRGEAESFVNGRASRDAEVAALEAVIEKVRKASESTFYMTTRRAGYTQTDYSKPLIEAKPIQDAIAEYRSGTTTEGTES
ncbi:MAG: hypothetical protein ABI067_17885 [Leifsonia sp.]